MTEIIQRLINFWCSHHKDVQSNPYIRPIASTSTCYAATMWLSLAGAFALPHADAAHPHGVMNMSGLTALLDWSLKCNGDQLMIHELNMHESSYYLWVAFFLKKNGTWINKWINRIWNHCLRTFRDMMFWNPIKFRHQIPVHSNRWVPPGDDTPIAPRDCTAIPWG